MSSVGKTIGMVFLVLMFLGAGLMPAFAVSDEIENITINYSENTCNTCCGGLEDANVTVVELTGKEKKKAIAEALKNEKVKNLLNISKTSYIL